jgi:hypothetical protein
MSVNMNMTTNRGMHRGMDMNINIFERETPTPDIGKSNLG